MPKITYKDIFVQVVQEIEKRTGFDQTSNFKSGTSRTQTQVSSHIDSGRNDITTAEVIMAIQNLLTEALPAYLVEGLIVTATSPVSSSVNISSGKGSTGGRLFNLENDFTLKIPLETRQSVYYINLYYNNIICEPNTSYDKLTIAKIVVPKPGYTDKIRDDRDGSWDAYIVNFQEYKLYGLNNKFEEDTVDLLRDNIGDILADNLIGNIRLSENLRVTNVSNSLVIDSNSLKILDYNDNTLAKFNNRGVFFYDGAGRELTRFTADNARIGNMLLTKNSIQSENFASGIRGFKIQDDGDAEFNDVSVRGTIYALIGEIGGWTIANDKLYASETGIIQTGVDVSAGQNGVRLDKDGLHVYNELLGRVVYLPSDGSAPSFSSGTIDEVVFEISTNSVLRTSENVGDGSSNSAGILINNSGLYGCGANQLLRHANLKVLSNGDVIISGEINATTGWIGDVSIADNKVVGGTIQGSNIVGATIQNSLAMPRVRIDDTGLQYQVSDSVGKYGTSGSGLLGFKYGDGTKYGAGVTAFLFNPNFPLFSVMHEHTLADIRLYNRTTTPSTGTHEIGDLLVSAGILRFCTTAGSPGTFSNLLDTRVLDTDGDLTANSDEKIATQKAIKSYSDTKIPKTDIDTNTDLGSSDTKVPSQKAVKTYSDTKATLLISIIEKTDNHTLELTDASKLIEVNKSSAITITIPANADVAFPIGTIIGFIQTGDGVVSFAAESGVTLNSLEAALDLIGKYSGATIVKTATDIWYLTGAIE